MPILGNQQEKNQLDPPEQFAISFLLMFLLRLAVGSLPATELEERGELGRKRGRNVAKKTADHAPRHRSLSIHSQSPLLLSKPQPGSPYLGLTSV